MLLTRSAVRAKLLASGLRGRPVGGPLQSELLPARKGRQLARGHRQGPGRGRPGKSLVPPIISHLLPRPRFLDCPERILTVTL